MAVASRTVCNMIDESPAEELTEEGALGGLDVVERAHWL